MLPSNRICFLLGLLLHCIQAGIIGSYPEGHNGNSDGGQNYNHISSSTHDIPPPQPLSSSLQLDHHLQYYGGASSGMQYHHQSGVDFNSGGQHETEHHDIPIKTIEHSKPVPVHVVKKVGVPVPHPVGVPVPQVIKVPVPQPYAVHIPVPQPIAVPIYRLVPQEIEKRVPITVEKLVPVQIPKPYKIEIEKHHPVHVDRPYPVHVPVIKHVYRTHKYGGWH